jgi:SulP family sulfate permease
LTRSVVNDAAGARTRIAGVWTVLLVALIVLFFAPLLANLPRTVLAAIILVAVQRLIDIKAFLRVWRYDRADGMAWVVTSIGVLAAGVESGLIAGLVLSLLQYIWRTANPHVIEVGRVPHTELYLELDRHHELETWPQLLLLRIDESLFFGNSARVADAVAEKLDERPDVTDLILICSAVNAIDASAIEMLDELIDSLKRTGVTTHLAHVKGPVMDRLIGSHLVEQLGQQRIHVSTEAAIVALAAPPI